MKETPVNGWDMVSLPIWGVLFVCGLAPDLAYHGLRSLANVPPQSAMINSSSAITIALAGYIAIFALRRCREAGAAEDLARRKAIVAGLMGLTAFLELPGSGTSPFEPRTFLEVWVHFQSISDLYVRNVLVVLGIGKLFCWWYLFGLMLRYHAFGNRRVFLLLPALFSLRAAMAPDAGAENEADSAGKPKPWVK